MKHITIPFLFLWGSGISYIFYDSYQKNCYKKKYNMILLKEETKKPINYNKFDDPTFNPFRPY